LCYKDFCAYLRLALHLKPLVVNELVHVPRIIPCMGQMPSLWLNMFRGVLDMMQMHSVGKPRRGSGELRMGHVEHRGRAAGHCMMSSAMQLPDDVMSRIHSCPVVNAQREWRVGRKTMTRLRARLLNWRVYEAWTRCRSDMRQALSYLARLTYLTANCTQVRQFIWCCLHAYRKFCKV
jgi:hypothetical protein